jgi:hypothetical protein
MRSQVIATTCFVISLIAAPNLGVTAPLDGNYTVSGGPEAGYAGARGCGDWSVRLRVAQGQLSGIVVVSRGSPALEGIILQPDGSFTGSTRAGGGSRPEYQLGEYRVSGKFSGDAVSVSMATGDGRCQRSGQGVRVTF